MRPFLNILKNLRLSSTDQTPNLLYNTANFVSLAGFYLSDELAIQKLFMTPVN